MKARKMQKLEEPKALSLSSQGSGLAIFLSFMTSSNFWRKRVSSLEMDTEVGRSLCLSSPFLLYSHTELCTWRLLEIEVKHKNSNNNNSSSNIDLLVSVMGPQFW